MDILYTSNISSVVSQEIGKIQALKDNVDPLLRELATDTIALFKDRIHNRGEDATGTAIGEYTEPYLSYRQDIYKLGSKYVRGKNKGQERPRFNRTSDPKVILSLTRQLENDYAIIPSGNTYGVGFNNPVNFTKARENEERYKKQIFEISPSELDILIAVQRRFFDLN